MGQSTAVAFVFDAASTTEERARLVVLFLVEGRRCGCVRCFLATALRGGLVLLLVQLRHRQRVLVFLTCCSCV